MSDQSDEEIAEGRLTVGRAQDAVARSQRPYILTLPVATCLEASDPSDNVRSTRSIHIFSSND